MAKRLALALALTLAACGDGGPADAPGIDRASLRQTCRDLEVNETTGESCRKWVATLTDIADDLYCDEADIMLWLLALAEGRTPGYGSCAGRG